MYNGLCMDVRAYQYKIPIFYFKRGEICSPKCAVKCFVRGHLHTWIIGHCAAPDISRYEVDTLQLHTFSNTHTSSPQVCPMETGISHVCHFSHFKESSKRKRMNAEPYLTSASCTYFALKMISQEKKNQILLKTYIYIIDFSYRFAKCNAAESYYLNANGHFNIRYIHCNAEVDTIF